MNSPSCRILTAKAGEYLERSLPVKQHLALRFHLMMCPTCRRFLRQHQIAQMVFADRAPVTEGNLQR